jgi:hypothetical protein
MGTKENHNGSKTIQSLRSILVRGRGQIAVVEDTPVDAYDNV